MNEPINKEERLAYELATTLNDMEALPLYTSFCYRYKEAHLRKILNRVMSIPDEKIKRTRGALFTFLIKENERHNYRNQS